MSFWLDDDDDVAAADPWSNGGTQGQTSSSGGGALTNGTSSHNIYSQSQSQVVQFCCDNCGGTESYTDAASGMDVCGSCFTQSQAMSQPAETDWEDVVGLAARTAGGRIKRANASTKTTHSKRKLGDTGRSKQPLSELDRSVRLPDTATCLKGMRHVLQRAVRIVVDDLLPTDLPPTATSTTAVGTTTTFHSFEEGQGRNETLYNDENDDRQQEKDRLHHVILETVRQLWLAYIRAWADGAELYGSLYPAVRFNFRDAFLDHVQTSQLVRQHLPYNVKTKSSSLNLPVPPTDVKSDGDAWDGLADDKGNDNLTEKEKDVRSSFEAKAAASDAITERKVVGGGRGGGPRTLAGYKRRKRPSPYVHNVRHLAIRQVIQAHSSSRGRRKRKGYQEAALLLRPSMTMAAALIWLAVTKHPDVPHDDSTYAAFSSCIVTSHDICAWIASGRLPLMTAFSALLSNSKTLQRQLQPVASFFKMDKAPDPSDVEAVAMQLCLACRLRVVPQPIVNTTMSNEGTMAANDNDDDDHDTDTDSRTVDNTIKDSVPHTKTSSSLSLLAVVTKSGRQDVVRFWPVASLPMILARLVASLGLDQGVLDRALLLAGFSLNDPNDTSTSIDPTHKVKAVPAVVLKEELTRMDELLALIAIACQLDANWQSWTFQYAKTNADDTDTSTASNNCWEAPGNEAQFRSLIRQGPSLRSYLTYIEQHVYPDGKGEADDDNDDENDLMKHSMLPVDYLEADRQLTFESKEHALDVDQNDDEDANDDSEEKHAIVVRPCTLVSGGRLLNERDVTNLTFRRNNTGLEQLHLKRKYNKRSQSTADQPPQPIQPKRRKIKKDIDALHTIPIHDFNADRTAASDWIPRRGHGSSGGSCADQERLVQFLAYSTKVDPLAIQRSIHRILNRQKL